MSLKKRLEAARLKLAAAGISDASLEAEILLRQVLKLDRAALLASLDTLLAPEQNDRFEALLARRLKRKPSAYITGHREFYGLDFQVDARVLIPRPESELLVAAALDCCRGRDDLTLADIGTGCGALAVALAVNLSEATLYATDVSADALVVAAANCRAHGVESRVQLLQGDLLAPLPGPLDVIVANLPYVTDAEMTDLPPEVGRYEPHGALAGGPDGLGLINRLCDAAPPYLNPGGCLLLEMGPAQTATVAARLQRIFPAGTVSVLPDLAGRPRVVRLQN